MKRFLMRLGASILRPVMAEVVRDEVEQLIATKLLLDESYQKACEFRVPKQDAHRQCVRLAGLAMRHGLILPLLQLAQHLLLELNPVDSTGAGRVEKCLEQEP